MCPSMLSAGLSIKGGLEWVLVEPGWFGRRREPAACLLQRLGWGWQSSATWEVIRKDNKLPLAGSLGL